MQVTSLLSKQENEHHHDHDHDDGCASCGHDHEHTPIRLVQTVIGVVFVLNAFVVDWAFDSAHTAASASAMATPKLVIFKVIAPSRITII